VAVSVAMWPQITVNRTQFPKTGIGSGPAIKYLAPVDTRFWIPQWLSPEGMSDVLGMTWEGTDNQADTAGFDLTVFAGGKTAVNAINNGGTDGYFKPLISALYPEFATSGGTFVNWPGNPAVRTGYSCPELGQVVNRQKTYLTPYEGRLFVAGEHTSPAWFGFMEGALESGLRAAILMAEAADLL
jgi:monoamine oxidase